MGRWGVCRALLLGLLAAGCHRAVTTYEYEQPVTVVTTNGTPRAPGDVTTSGQAPAVSEETAAPPTVPTAESVPAASPRAAPPPRSSWVRGERQ